MAKYLITQTIANAENNVRLTVIQNYLCHGISEEKDVDNDVAQILKDYIDEIVEQAIEHGDVDLEDADDYRNDKIDARQYGLWRENAKLCDSVEVASAEHGNGYYTEVMTIYATKISE